MKTSLVIFLSFLVALLLLIVPLPDYAQFYRPNTVAIILIYWSMALPNSVRLIIAFSAGLIVDILLGSILGQHSLAFIILVYINLSFNLRIRVLALWQQAFYVFMLLLIVQFFIVWIEGIMGSQPPIGAYFYPALTGMLIWPWAYIILRDVRRGAMK